MEATALGVKNLFNTVSVDNLVVKETLQSQDVTVSGSMDTGTNTTIVASSLKPSETDVIHVGSPTHRFKRVYCDDFDVGVTHANKYLKTDASGVVGYETVHDPVTIGTANGLSLSGQVLSLSTATTAASGAMSQTDKVNHDSLVGNLFGSTINIGNTGVGVTNAINIGTGEGISTVNLGTGSGPTTINIGSTGDTINLQGTTVTVDTQNAQVTDAVLTLNKNGVNRNSVGIEILATDNSGPLGAPVEYVAAAVKTNGTGDTLEVKGVSGITKVNVGGQVTVDQSAGTTTCSKNVIMNTTDANVLSLKGTATNSALKAQYEQSGTTYDILDVKAIGITSNRPIFLRNLANTTQTSLWDDKIYNSTGALVLRGGGSSSTDAGLTVQNNFGVTTLEIKNDGTTSGTCDIVVNKLTSSEKARIGRYLQYEGTFSATNPQIYVAPFPSGFKWAKIFVNIAAANRGNIRMDAVNQSSANVNFYEAIAKHLTCYNVESSYFFNAGGNRASMYICYDVAYGFDNEIEITLAYPRNSARVRQQLHGTASYTREGVGSTLCQFSANSENFNICGVTLWCDAGGIVSGSYRIEYY